MPTAEAWQRDQTVELKGWGIKMWWSLLKIELRELHYTRPFFFQFQGENTGPTRRYINQSKLAGQLAHFLTQQHVWGPLRGQAVDSPLDWQWLPSLSCAALTPFGFSQPLRSKCHQWQRLSAQKHHLKWKKQAHPRNGGRSLIYWTNIMISSCLPRYQGFPTTRTWGNNGLVRGKWSIRNTLPSAFPQGFTMQ